MLLLYTKAFEAIRAVLQYYLLDSSQLCLTGDSWSASNSNSYLDITVYQTDAKQQIYSCFLNFVYLLLSYTSKALFNALISTCKHFGIEDYILSITIDNYIVNNSIVRQFKIYTIKSIEKGNYSKLLLVIFKVSNSYIYYIVYTINLLV